MTAAHCVFDPMLGLQIPPKYWVAKFGETDLVLEESHEKVRYISKIVIHEAFRRNAYENDVALMYLSQPIDIRHEGHRINTICLPRKNQTFEGQICTVTGWGKIKLKSPTKPTVLLKTQLPVWMTKDCAAAYSNVTKMSNTTICAGLVNGGAGACVGDSGGPLQCRQDDSWVLAGIVSWGIGCAEPGKPSVFVRVTSFLDWIQRQIGETDRSGRNFPLPWEGFW